MQDDVGFAFLHGTDGACVTAQRMGLHRLKDRRRALFGDHAYEHAFIRQMHRFEAKDFACGLHPRPKRYGRFLKMHAYRRLFCDFVEHGGESSSRRIA